MTPAPQNKPEGVRRKIAKQIVLARIPGYKHTNGELNDEIDSVPGVYIDNILAVVAAELERVRPEKKEEPDDIPSWDLDQRVGYNAALDQYAERIAEVLKRD